MSLISCLRAASCLSCARVGLALRLTLACALMSSGAGGGGEPGGIAQHNHATNRAHSYPQPDAHLGLVGSGERQGSLCAARFHSRSLFLHSSCSVKASARVVAGFEILPAFVWATDLKSSAAVQLPSSLQDLREDCCCGQAWTAGRRRVRLRRES